MKVNFEKVVVPCVVNEVTLWHVEHGWLWDVVEVPSGRRLGVFFCTLLCGDGCIIHFYSLPDIPISAATTLYAFRKAVNMVSGYGVVYATIPLKKSGLIRVLLGLGFMEVAGGGYQRDSEEIVLLKYLGDKKVILTEETSKERK